MAAWPGVLVQYRPLLSIPQDTPVVTLLEGNTPLIPMPRLARHLGAAEVHVKYEGLNPTGSFKDRGMAVAVSVALARAEGRSAEDPADRAARAVICASTGNTAASAAAYAARTGFRCLVVIPQGQVAAGKLAGAAAYGAEILQIEGPFDRALELVKEVTSTENATVVNSLNPDRLEGQKTAAFEICEALGRAPDWLALPVGNAGNISAYALGFRQHGESRHTGMPRLLGAQAEGAAPLVLGRPIEHPQTVASAIRIGNPARGQEAIRAARASGGRIVAVPDSSILSAQAHLAGEGVWVEPASAAGLAALEQESQAGRLALREQAVVIVATGHGLKDPDVAPAPPLPRRTIPAEAEALREALRA
jgi:threonine synthase